MRLREKEMTMNRLSVLVAGLALSTSCTNSPTSSSTVPAATPSNPTFTADLRPSNVVPPVTNAESTGSGSGTITFILTRDSQNNITSGTANFVGAVQGFPAGMTLTAARIFQGAAGVTASTPLVNLALTQPL